MRLGPIDVFSESMHSLKGAFSETVYIYGTAIETCLKGLIENSTAHSPLPAPRIFSLGLGLGYVEILAAALILKTAREFPGIRQTAGGESFEIVPELRDWFGAWVLGNENSPSSSTPVPENFQQAYEDILGRTAEQTAISAPEILTQLREMILSERWKIRPALTTSTGFNQKFQCICFDAFSSKTSPDLWTEEFLTDFFNKVAADSCVLATYACTGALKRTLRSAGFELTIRQGFSSKRDSTFAVRGLKSLS